MFYISYLNILSLLEKFELFVDVNLAKFPVVSNIQKIIFFFFECNFKISINGKVIPNTSVLYNLLTLLPSQ